ncbi:MAG: ZIP family metal transporter [Bacillota bacterium]|jgi:ZIP family zinc transporter
MELSEVLLIGAAAGLATSLGGIIANYLPVNNEKCLETLLGFAGGIMIGLSLFQLMPEGYFFARGVVPAAAGFLTGIAVMALLSRFFHFGDNETKTLPQDYQKTGLFIGLAIALHNLPEGIAIGVGFAGGSGLGFMIAVAMMLHNVPEGIGVGAPLKKGGSSFGSILAVTTLTGLMTPLGAALGWWFGHFSMMALGAAMGMAAGAMVYVALTKLLSAESYWNDLGAFCGILLTFIIA